MTSLAVTTSLPVSCFSYDASSSAFSSLMSLISKSKLKLLSKCLSKPSVSKPLWLYFYFLTFLILVILVFYGNSYDAHRHLYIFFVSDGCPSCRLLTSNLHFLHDFHQLCLHLTLHLEIEK